MLMCPFLQAMMWGASRGVVLIVEQRTVMASLRSRHIYAPSNLQSISSRYVSRDLEKERDIEMRSMLIVSGSMLLAAPLHAESQVVVKPVLSTTVTSSGQPIVLPQKDAQVVVSTYEIAPGATLPEHKHPFPRYGYVLSGALRVINDDTGKTEDYKTGDFILESVGQWHRGINPAQEPLKLLVIDIAEKGQPTVVLKK
jgi:quercetin dioxygenase-like cupin family protein